MDSVVSDALVVSAELVVEVPARGVMTIEDFQVRSTLTDK